MPKLLPFEETLAKYKRRKKQAKFARESAEKAALLLAQGNKLVYVCAVTGLSQGTISSIKKRLKQHNETN